MNELKECAAFLHVRLETEITMLWKLLKMIENLKGSPPFVVSQLVLQEAHAESRVEQEFPTSLSLEEMHCSILIFLFLKFNKHLLSIEYVLGCTAGTRNIETQHVVVSL